MKKRINVLVNIFLFISSWILTTGLILFLGFLFDSDIFTLKVSVGLGFLVGLVCLGAQFVVNNYKKVLD